MTYSVLSATAKLGIAAEVTDPVYAPPSFTIPFSTGTRYRDHIIQLHDRTVRGTDTDLQDIVQGPRWSEWTIRAQAYADWAGWLYRAMIGPDACTPGTVTTFAAGSAAGAVTVQLSAAPPAGSVLMLGTGGTLEYAQCGTPSGTGPFAVPLTAPAAGLRFAHGPGDPAQSRAVHVFRQDRPYGSVWPSYSLSTGNGVEILGWPGCILGKASLRIPAEGWAALDSEWSGFPPAPVTAFAESESAAQPAAGWAWQITTAGGASARGGNLDLALSRPLEQVTCCNGQQAPLVIAAGSMRADASYEAIFDTTADLDLYRQALQEPAVWTLAQPVLQGGSVIAVTLARSGWTDGHVSLDDAYVSAEFTLSGITNVADSASGGVSSVQITNFVQQPYGP